MKRIIRAGVQFLLVGVFLITSAVSAFAAEVRRVPDYGFVEQGLMALTLDAEGAENFRYTGLENKMHVYRGKIKPGSKLKLVIRATLGGEKTLPITGRSCSVRMQIVAKKGGKVIKTQNFRKDNRSNLFLNYTLPKGADAVEVSETFVLNNKSNNKQYNKQMIERSRLILTASDTGAAVPAGKTGGSGTKKSGDGKAGIAGDAGENGGSGKGILAGAAVAAAAIAGGGYFFLKKRKEDQAANEEIARKEKLRRQAIQRQQELMREQETNRQQAMPEAGQQDAAERPGGFPQNGNAAAAGGAAGVVGSGLDNAAGNAPETVKDTVPHFCENCGAPLKPGSRFCENCGEKV